MGEQYYDIEGYSVSFSESDDHEFGCLCTLTNTHDIRIINMDKETVKSLALLGMAVVFLHNSKQSYGKFIYLPFEIPKSWVDKLCIFFKNILTKEV